MKTPAAAPRPQSARARAASDPAVHYAAISVCVKRSGEVIAVYTHADGDMRQLHAEAVTPPVIDHLVPEEYLDAVARCAHAAWWERSGQGVLPF